MIDQYRQEPGQPVPLGCLLPAPICVHLRLVPLFPGTLTQRVPGLPIRTAAEGTLSHWKGRVAATPQTRLGSRIGAT
jgi:hypothetical protein